MAVVTEYNDLSAKFTLERDNETTSRTISIGQAQDDPTSQIAAFRTFVLGSASTLMQPTNWRDGDVAEDEWKTTAVTFTLNSGVKTVFDDTDLEG